MLIILHTRHANNPAQLPCGAGGTTYTAYGPLLHTAAMQNNAAAMLTIAQYLHKKSGKFLITLLPTNSSSNNFKFYILQGCRNNYYFAYIYEHTSMALLQHIYRLTS